MMLIRLFIVLAIFLSTYPFLTQSVFSQVAKKKQSPNKQYRIDSRGELSPRGQKEQNDGHSNYQFEEQSIYQTPQQRHCARLEKQLAHQWLARSKSRDILPKLNEELLKTRTEYRKVKAKAEKLNCYENVFIFGKRLKENRKCRKIGRKVKTAEKKLDHLQRQKRSVLTYDTSEEDFLISKLARNGCGENYVKEDRRRNRSIFSFDNDFDNENKESKSSTIPFATYRTMCVRRCDGFYYPISFSTLPSRFPQDSAICQSQCAAPADLFVYKNPGEEIDQMIFFKRGTL